MHRSERADRLVDALGDLLAEPLEDPMVSEVVAVPTRGVERWLSQRLSHRLGAGPGRGDGVCANIRFPFPGTLVGGATARCCGTDPDADPWPPARSVWPLLELVDAHLDEPFLAPLAAHLRAASPGAAEGGHLRRLATVRHLADLYDRYAVHRPDLLQAWAAGARAPEGYTGAAGPAGEAALDWQGELWRRLRARIGVPSPAERFGAAAARLAGDPEVLDLPARISLFGLTRLPASYLLVLEAMAAGRDVHLFLLHPSATLWERVAGRAAAEWRGARPPAGLGRSGDPTSALPTNPLLRSWARDAREMQLVLMAHGVAGGEHRPIPEEPPTLLGRIQADIRADRAPPGRPRPGRPDARAILAGGDGSLQIHSCHGRARQVEVMRDALLHLLADDPTLEPRDIVVMCPDIETFAPLVHAAFGAGDPGAGDAGAGGPVSRGSVAGLRVRLADRSLRQTNPLLAVAAHLLELAGARVTASEVVDLAWREPVRRRFRLDDDDLAQIQRWVAEMGVRWGLDGDHRAAWKLGRVPDNTWSFGLDRLLLGVAMAEEDQRLFGATLPVDDVAGAVEVAGRLAELVSRLGAALTDLARPQPLERWVEGLVTATEALALAGPSDAWQHDQLRRVLGEPLEEAAAAEAGEAAAAEEAPAAEGGTARVGGAGSVLDLAEVRALLADRLRGRPTRANFRTGDLTVCTLVPMRSVPHRVVGLLGLDEGAFPRHAERDGDDLLLAHPRVGDRDARSEDRQLLLDALLAATSHLVVTYGGRDDRTNQELPPAVPVAELLDVVDRTARGAGGALASRTVLVRHPLQSFDPRNFTPGGLRSSGPWAFDPVDLEGARALGRPRRAPEPFLPRPLPPLASPVVALEDLIRFVQNPVQGFLRQRLGVHAGRASDTLDDALPVELDGLEKWAVGDRLLEARLGGADAYGALAAERARGTLPPGPLADRILDEVAGAVEALVAAFEAQPGAGVEPESVELRLSLPDGRALVGTVGGVRAGTVARCVYSRLGPKHRLAAWVRFLALSAACPDLAVTALTVGRGRRRGNGGHPVALGRLGPLPGGPDARASGALDHLAVVIDLYGRGLREPLPLYCDTSEAWASAVRGGRPPVKEAHQRWRSSWSYPGEDANPEHKMVLGGRATFDQLLSHRPSGDEAGPGWDMGQSSRLGRLACRLWDGILALERIEERR